MSETQARRAVAASATDQALRLHPSSVLFACARLIRVFALPLLGILLLGRKSAGWELYAAVPLGLMALWSVLRVWNYRYQVIGEELVIREGVLGRELRHVPFARIHGSSQRRQIWHRMLGVTELRLESAAGGKPEAVMQVLGLRAAAELEQRLRHSKAEPQVTAPVSAAFEVEAPAERRSWLRLDLGEIVRLGLISNRGMVLVGLFFGAVMPREDLRRTFLNLIQVPLHALRAYTDKLFDAGHGSLAVLELGLLLLLALVLLRLLSVVLAVFKYHGFHLEQQGERLLVHRGLSTQVSASARLPRLQRWELRETWLHRRFGRCHLGVTVAGETDLKEHGVDPGGRFDELAPVATPEQAHALLRQCLPQLRWDALQWQALPAVSFWRRLIGQARWVLPLVALALWLNFNAEIHVPLLHQALSPLDWPALVVTLSLLGGAWVWQVRAWCRFAAYAEQGELLLWRHGVWTRRWVLLSAPRLQQLSLYSSALDRSLGLCHLRADTQGGRRSGRALDIPSLDVDAALRLRHRLWQYLQRPY